jgi:hypothetical protein
MIHLDDNIYVVAKMYDESLQIHIRQYTQFGNKLYSTKKGVVLKKCSDRADFHRDHRVEINDFNNFFFFKWYRNIVLLDYS